MTLLLGWCVDGAITEIGSAAEGLFEQVQVDLEPVRSSPGASWGHRLRVF